MTDHFVEVPKKVLSPAAQAVLDAFSKDEGGVYLEDDPERLSFAIRELADQVVPENDEPDWGACTEMRCDIEIFLDHQHKRKAILAIATELEALLND